MENLAINLETLEKIDSAALENSQISASYKWRRRKIDVKQMYWNSKDEYSSERLCILAAGTVIAMVSYLIGCLSRCSV